MNKRQVRGSVTLEYSVLVGAIGLGAAVAFVGLAVALLDNFELVRRFVLYPFP